MLWALDGRVVRIRVRLNELEEVNGEARSAPRRPTPPRPAPPRVALCRPHLAVAGCGRGHDARVPRGPGVGQHVADRDPRALRPHEVGSEAFLNPSKQRLTPKRRVRRMARAPQTARAAPLRPCVPLATLTPLFPIGCSGRLLGWVDLRGLRAEAQAAGRSGRIDVLNGIAHR